MPDVYCGMSAHQAITWQFEFEFEQPRSSADAFPLLVTALPAVVLDHMCQLDDEFTFLVFL